LNLHVLSRDLYRMHVSALASVNETVAMTDGVVGESLIAEPNVAPRPLRHPLTNGVQGSMQHLMMANDVSTDRSGTAASMVLSDSRPTPTQTKVVALWRVACRDYLSPTEAALIYLHNLVRSPKLLRKGRQ